MEYALNALPATISMLRESAARSSLSVGTSTDKPASVRVATKGMKLLMVSALLPMSPPPRIRAAGPGETESAPNAQPDGTSAPTMFAPLSMTSVEHGHQQANVNSVTMAT